MEELVVSNWFESIRWVSRSVKSPFYLTNLIGANDRYEALYVYARFTI